MSDNKVTLDQLDNSAIEAMTSSVGDVSTLNTENKTIVGALAEIVGKKEIANAIGEPLTETDSFKEMSNGINGLLSQFKTNMMNSGVVVENGDKFKQLIDKIQGLTEGEGNKGIQYAEITQSFSVYKASGVSAMGNSVSLTKDILFDIDFEPTIIILDLPQLKGSACNSDGRVLLSLDAPKYTFSNTSYTMSVTLTELTSTSAILTFGGRALGTSSQEASILCSGNIKIYAIGVGEEDTALRDSLASILQEEGVSVTEEDNMASLITKVDEEFDEMNNEINNLNNQVNQVNNSYDSLKNVLTTKDIIVPDNASFDDLITMVNNTLYWERLAPGQTNTYFTSDEGNYLTAVRDVSLLVKTVEMSLVNFPSYPIAGITCKVSNLGFGATDYMGAYITVNLEGSDGTVKSTDTKYYKMTQAATDYFNINTTVLKTDKIKVYFMLSPYAYDESVSIRQGTVSIMGDIKKS